MATYQHTIAKPVSCYGLGIHSGQVGHLILKPAPVNHGIVFVRTDVKSVNNFIEASYQNISDSTLCTKISNKDVYISTIEHLMAALYGHGIDNLIIELDCSEVPILDGSSRSFSFMLECAGKIKQSAKRKYLKIQKEVSVSYKDSEVYAIPSDDFAVKIAIDFSHKLIGKQELYFNSSSSFASEISPARTFGFIRDLEKLKEQGLAKGASLDNAIGLDHDKILNPEGLRYEDEFVRHKMLDSLGDFYAAQAPIIGFIGAKKPSHAMNNALLRAIFSNKSNYRWASK